MNTYFNYCCKDKASEKKVKCFTAKTAENVDKMDFLLISQALKRLYSKGFGNNPPGASQEIHAIHGFSTR